MTLSPQLMNTGLICNRKESVGADAHIGPYIECTR